MERSAQHKALIAGTGLVMAGALAGTVTLLSGGASPSAARPAGTVRAQHVDLTNPSTSAAPAAQPAPSDSPAAQPSHESFPDPHHRFLDLKVMNPNGYQVQACVDNSAVGVVCTKSLGFLHQREELDHVTVDPTSDTATVTAEIPVSGSNATNKETLDLPVSLDTVTTHCVLFTETELKSNFKTTTTRHMVEDLGCSGF